MSLVCFHCEVCHVLVFFFFQNMQVILPPQPQLHSCCRRYWRHYLSPPAVGVIFILLAPEDDVSVRIFSSHCIPGKKCVLLKWSRKTQMASLFSSTGSPPLAGSKCVLLSRKFWLLSWTHLSNFPRGWGGMYRGKLAKQAIILVSCQ